MPETLDLQIPNKEGSRKALYRLELLRGDITPTQLSIYHLRIEEKKTKAAMVRQVKTYGFCFECGTGKLTYVSIHKGDFTKPSFRWFDTRDEQFEEEQIPGVVYLQAIKYAELAYAFLQDEEEKASTYKEKERYGRFLSPLETILDRK
ncbi:MAG: hypothetical protein AABX31_02280 [Nanoarchaeota archaeon]